MAFILNFQYGLQNKAEEQASNTLEKCMFQASVVYTTIQYAHYNISETCVQIFDLEIIQKPFL